MQTYADWKVVGRNGVRGLAPPDDSDPPCSAVYAEALGNFGPRRQAL